MKVTFHINRVTGPALIVFITLCLTSCRTVKTSISRRSEKLDSTAVKKEVDLHVQRQDSSGFNLSKRGEVQQFASSDGRRITIHFAPDTSRADTGRKTEPVKLQFNEDGSATADFGGRQPESISYEQKTQKKKRDSTGTTDKQAVKKTSSDSASHVASDSNSTQKQVTDFTKHKRSSSLPWWIWLLLPIGVMVFTISVKTGFVHLKSSS